jgi:crotonobetainyl-CoA:carnitine CoA-transferase CaiB-like acyl-CoA transferase
MSPTHDAPYRGLRVLDFGQGIASPYCAMLLGVYGAEVIKVEPPEGDWSRYLGTTYGSHTALSAVYNRGKRSLCLDLKHDEGIRIARQLAGDCDVFIEGFRPGVAARLGIGYEDLARDNPGLIYLSVSGFGQDGPYSRRPGSDSVAQAFSGLVSVNVGNDKTPHRVGTTISDVATGVYAFQAIAPRCSRARALARAAGSMSASHNRRLPCSATRSPSMFWREALRAHSMYRRVPTKQGMAGSWSPW